MDLCDGHDDIVYALKIERDKDADAWLFRMMRRRKADGEREMLEFRIDNDAY
jgi:hypothetical protein